jgi:hypothetical protein
MEGSTTERIIEQVRKCLSGALSYFLNDAASDADKVVAESANILKVEVAPMTPTLQKQNA